MSHHQNGIVYSNIFDDTRFHGQHVAHKGRGLMPVELEELAEEKDFEKNPGHYLSIGSRIRELFASALQFHADPDEDSWVFKRHLGHGSFGIAALYEKEDFDHLTAIPGEKFVVDVSIVHNFTI